MFEWHKDKEILNIKKHNISFSEASTVFDDYFALYIEDEAHSINEERFVIIGYSNQNKLITSVFTERMTEKGKVARIISARKSTKNEKKLYEEKSKYN
jgi:uncharacterized protein